MKNNYQVCNDCCELLGLEINSIITSRCRRKCCDICGWDTSDDLSMISKKVVNKKIKEYKLKNNKE